MVVLIVAGIKTSSGKLGIGYKNTIPWYCPEDLVFFKKTTLNKNIVMGMKTFKSLKSKLPNRNNIVITRNKYCKNEKNLIFTDRLLEQKELFVIGGAQIYDHYLLKARRILLTEIISDQKVEIDTYFPEIPDTFKITNYSEIKQSTTKGIRYRFITFERNTVFNEREYLKLGAKILEHGSVKEDRTGTGTISLFSETLKFDISESIPILTTKKVAWKSAITEMLFFLSGKSDTKELEKKGINIWKGNTSREFLDKRGLFDIPAGTLSFGYGHQIRHFGSDINGKGGFDQLSYITDLIQNDPNSRRILWNLWSLKDLEKQTLCCCHLYFQVYINTETRSLSGHVTLRSNDYFLGNPFNIVGYCMLIYILALKYNYKPGTLSISMIDVHIYRNHIEQMKLQLTRSIRSAPVLKLNPEIKNKDWSDISINDFELIGYYNHPSIKGKMAI